MESLSTYLTIEPLLGKERFENNFQLCNYAIQLVQNLTADGQDHFVSSPIQNDAYNTLQSILIDEDQDLELSSPEEEVE